MCISNVLMLLDSPEQHVLKFLLILLKQKSYFYSSRLLFIL